MARTNPTDAEYLQKKLEAKLPLNRAERRAYAKQQRKQAAKGKRRGGADE